jgi:GT2 family glycosyltransferase
VDWVSGASILLRASLLKTVGPMDEGYFLYFEEVDYCRAIQKAGYQVWHHPASRVIHHVGAATGISNTRLQAPRRPTYWFDSRRRYFLKNHGLIKAVVADCLWLVGYASWKLRNIVQRKPDSNPPYFMRDFFSHSIIVYAIKRKNKKSSA